MSAPATRSTRGRRSRRNVQEDAQDVNPGTNNDASLAQVVAQNSQAIQNLQSLPEQFEQLKALILATRPPGSVIDGGAQDVQDDDEDQLEENTEHNATGNVTEGVFPIAQEVIAMTGNAVAQGNKISQILKKTESEPEYGPALDEEVANSFSKLIHRKESKEETDALKKKFMVPSNCKTLCVQKVESDIWTVLPNKARQADFHLQSIQSHVSLTSIALAKLAEKIATKGATLPGNWQSELLESVLEIALINSNTNLRIIAKRKREMRRNMPSKEAATLCSNQNEPNEYLFGDNVHEKIKTAKAALNLIKPKTHAFKKLDNRFTPYPTASTSKQPPENYQGPLRGNAARGGARIRHFHQQDSTATTPGSSRQHHHNKSYQNK